MPAVTGDRFSSQNMADCPFCPAGGRQFRTGRQCAECGKPLCLICRPEVPKQPFLCPDCGGGPVEDAIHAPGPAIERIRTAGQPIPYWLTLLQQRIQVTSPEAVENEIVPE